MERNPELWVYVPLLPRPQSHLNEIRCPFTSLVISNIETTFLPSNTASSLSSARMLRFSLGSWSSCLRMYSQSFLVSSVRGSGSLPTTAASAASGCTGLLRAFLGAAAFFGVGIRQLERAGLGCQAKNQPCFQRFAGAPRRISADRPGTVQLRADL